MNCSRRITISPTNTNYRFMSDLIFFMAPFSVSSLSPHCRSNFNQKLLKTFLIGFLFHIRNFSVSDGPATADKIQKSCQVSVQDLVFS